MEAPLSAFFGCAYDENFVDRDGKYPVLNSAMMLVAPGRGYNSYFEMPFHKRARITMENRGDKDENSIKSPELIRRFRRRLVIYYHRFRRVVPTQSLTESKAGTICRGDRQLDEWQQACWVEGEARMYLDDDPYPSIDRVTMITPAVAYWYQTLPSAPLMPCRQMQRCV